MNVTGPYWYDMSTLVQVMAWCRQATSHYLSQCWPRSMSPNGVARPQWVNSNKSCGTKFINSLNVTTFKYAQLKSYDTKIINSLNVTTFKHAQFKSCNTKFINSMNNTTFNTLRPRQNGRHFADAIFKRIFVNENIWIPIKISLKFVPKGSINNIPALVPIMAWRRPGDKPLSEPMMVNLPMYICINRPQWVNAAKLKMYAPCYPNQWLCATLQ